ncbi:MAG: biopolymer transporter ExbD [Thermoguttaceae bacterium]
MSKKPLYEDLVDMTAMVDIVFFVLIFFMVTSMQTMFTAIDMPTPDREKTAAKGARSSAEFERDGFIIVRIDRDNTIWVNDSEVAGGSERELRIKLGEAKGPGSGPSKMLVLGNSEATHGTLVLVLDAGSDAGMDDMQLAIEDDS